VRCLGPGQPPSPIGGKGGGGELLHMEACAGVPATITVGTVRTGCCIYCAARCPQWFEDISPAGAEKFPPFSLSPASPAARVHIQFFGSVAADCGQKFPFHPLLHHIFPGSFSALGPSATIPPAPHGKVPVLLLCSPSVLLGCKPSRPHLSPVFGRAFPAGAPLGKHTPGDVSGSAQELSPPAA